MTNIVRKSVGSGCPNDASDVRIVQRLLNHNTQVLLTVDGIVGPKTIAAITQFQKEFTGIVDGRVDPHGPAILKLANLLFDSIEEGLSIGPRKFPRGNSADGLTPMRWYWELLGKP